MLPKVTNKDAQRVKEIDVSVLNKWKFKWLDGKVNILQGTNTDDVLSRGSLISWASPVSTV